VKSSTNFFVGGNINNNLKNQQTNKQLLQDSSSLLPNNSTKGEKLDIKAKSNNELTASDKHEKEADKPKAEANLLESTQPKVIRLNFKTIPAAPAQNNATNNIECMYQNYKLFIDVLI